ncbi:Rgg/GadR/MutR family transcriptional regulator [Lactobacillus hamsteri]|nr:Rgg/GadR/MutR family transcriptional regulator [Lactobacillus hamsteri]
MLGEKFRKLRKAKGINIYKAAEGITSKSSLQRWENGQGEMSIEKVMALLKKVHVQPDEFVRSLNDLKVYTKNVTVAYQNNDINELKDMASNLLNIYYLDHKNKKVFFQAAIACNYYMDFTNINLLNKNDVLRLRAYFSSIKNWTRENIVIFGNVQLLLDGEYVYATARSLLSCLIDNKNDDDFINKMAVTSLLNAVFVLIKKKSIKKACKLLTQIKHLKCINELHFSQIRIKYAEKVFSCIKRKNTQEMDDFLADLKSIGLIQQANDFALGFSQMKNIYGF